MIDEKSEMVEQDEEGFALELEPKREVVFDIPHPDNKFITATLNVTNPTGKLLAFKIKCTSNEFFRIRPATGVLEAMGSRQIELVYTPGFYLPGSSLGEENYFAVYYNQVVASSTASENEVFKDVQQLSGIRFIPIVMLRSEPEELNTQKENELTESETKLDTKKENKDE